MRKILFVCVENSCRSQMAEGFARKWGAGAVEASSAGSRPSGMVNPKAIELMREKGIELDPRSSKSIESLGPVEWDLVVTMGCGDACPFVRTKAREDWKIPDPRDMPLEEFRKVRDLIEEKVRTLLQGDGVSGEKKS